MLEGFSRISLGDEGKSFVVDYLDGNRGLSPRLKERVKLHGECFSYLPSSLSPNLAFNFNTGGIISTTGGPTTSSFEQHYAGLSRARGKGMLFFHDLYLIPEDTRYFPLSRFQLHSSDCVYFYLPHYAMSVAEIDEIQHEIACFDCVGAFADIEDAELQFLLSRNAIDELVDRIAATAVEVFVRAYDAEGFVFCRL